MRDIEIIYPPDLWKFDGHDENGTELPSGTYTYVVRAQNDCEEEEFGGLFINIYEPGTNETPDVRELLDPHPKFPGECCVECLFIDNSALLEGEFLILDGTYSFVAIDKIVLGPGVTTEGSNVTLQAGTQVIVLPTLTSFWRMGRLCIVLSINVKLQK